MSSHKYLVAIPVYNEAPRLPSVLARTAEFVSDILVIDDGSTDRTADILARHRSLRVIRHGHNQGYGKALADAFAFAARAGYDWLITMDCDDQHEPAFIPRFVSETQAEPADIVSGSRYLTHFATGTLPPPDRRAINHALTEMLNDRLGLGLTDAFCGFKAYRVAALAKLRITVPGYAMPLQLWVQAARAGLRVGELAVPLIYNDPKRSFGGRLDDPAERFRHYLEVLNDELHRAAYPTLADADLGQILATA